MVARNRRQLVNTKSSPNSKKVNLDEAPIDKRRKIGIGKVMAPPSNIRPRAALKAVNAVPGDTASVPSLDGGCSVSEPEISSREDVERLLDERITGVKKNDFKGKCEWQTGYIRKLRNGIKLCLEHEEGYVAEIEMLHVSMESEERRHSEIESQMKRTEEELNAAKKQLQIEFESLQERFKKEEAEKLAAISSYEKEIDTRIACENLKASLLDDLEKANQEMKRLNDQVKALLEANKRLQEYNTSLQNYNLKLQEEAASTADLFSRLQKEKSALMETVTCLREKTSTLQSQLDTARFIQKDAVSVKEELKMEVGNLRAELKHVREDRDQQVAQVQCLTVDIAKLTEQTGKYSKELTNLIPKADALEETCSSQRLEIQSLESQLTAANDKFKKASRSANEAVTEYEDQKSKVKELENLIADKESQIRILEDIRKRQNNTILELKGNIRVFCRVRPPLGNDGTDAVSVSYPTSIESLGRGVDIVHNGSNYSFTFDRVFGQDASQVDVFEEISELVQSALDGYKVCIFAYGQTGSGKTYTMMGKQDFPDQRGLIPRSLEKIFLEVQNLQCKGWNYSMQVSMLEIYKETICDLLLPNSRNSIDLHAPSKRYTISHDANGNTSVSGLTVLDVHSSEEISFLLEQAAQSRSVGRTLINEESSRSHFVFTLQTSGVNEITGQQAQGILNLIDLAGSERLDKSGSTGDRLKETQAINKSLSALGDVIFRLASKAEHVPFRNSKLTHLLQPCLGGDSKTLMFVNISPELSSAGESICSLRFASRVNTCEINIPRRHTQFRTSDSRLNIG